MLERWIAWASGEEPADLVLRNGRLVNVLAGEIHQADVAIAGGRVLGWGDYTAREVVDLGGRYICPGFIDGHVHIESAMVSPAGFARAVVPAGTTSAISDPHEIANVLGVEGIRYMLDASQGIPLNVFVMLPSCVPATPLETAGASLSASDLVPLLDEKNVIGLGEMMNYPGVLLRVPEIMDLLRLGTGRPIDGHAPALTGKALNAYIVAGMRSDHECITADEAQEKLRAGMHILIRQGSTARNLRELLDILTPANVTHCSFCTDDRHPSDLLDRGHMDDIVRQAIRAGLEPLTAIRMATINTARHYRLWDLGAVAPGYHADLLVLDDLETVVVSQVYKDGCRVAADGQMLSSRQVPSAPQVPSSFHVDWGKVSLEVVAPAGSSCVRVIGVVPDQIVTRGLTLSAKMDAGHAVADPARDILKIAVIERHRATGNVGIGFIQGFGLGRGALASSVAHDSHNIVTVGACDEDMLVAARGVAQMGGGQVVAARGKIVASLALPIAGLMSHHSLEDLRCGQVHLLNACQELGCSLPDPFMTLSFMALPVIPQLKLTDKGLVDVEQFNHISVWAD